MDNSLPNPGEPRPQAGVVPAQAPPVSGRGQAPQSYPPHVPGSVPAPGPAGMPTTPGGPTSPPPPAATEGTDEEAALRHVLRILHRPHRPGTLGPVERAFLAGAGVVFEHLARVCQAMLSEAIPPPAAKRTEPLATPKSIGSREEPDASAGPAQSAAAQPTAEGGSVVERLARLEARLDQITQELGRR